jgi:hypothetical protein
MRRGSASSGDVTPRTFLQYMTADFNVDFVDNRCLHLELVQTSIAKYGMLNNIINIYLPNRVC